MEDYSSNSHKSKQAQNKPNNAQKVVKGSTKTRKKSSFQRFVGAFISDDISSVRSYIFTDVFIPYIKRFIDDSVHTLLYRNGRDYYRSRGETEYNRYYSDRYNIRNDRVPPSHYGKYGYDYDEIVYDDRGDAELVLDTLRDRIAAYGYATVMDWYTASNRSCSYTYDNYGWSDLYDARVIPVKDGYVIKLPRACPIDERR